MFKPDEYLASEWSIKTLVIEAVPGSSPSNWKVFLLLKKDHISLKKILSWLCCLTSTYYSKKEQPMKGSGCGSVGRAVASDTRGLQLKYYHRQILYWTFVSSKLYWKDKNKEKEAGNGPFFKEQPI